LKPVRLVGDAAAELVHEISYHEAVRRGTGVRFAHAVSDAFAIIRAFPHGGAPAPAGTRRTKVRGFPFTVVYRDYEGEIVVFAIAADRRRPGYWTGRLHDG